MYHCLERAFNQGLPWHFVHHLKTRFIRLIPGHGSDRWQLLLHCLGSRDIWKGYVELGLLFGTLDVWFFAGCAGSHRRICEHEPLDLKSVGPGQRVAWRSMRKSCGFITAKAQESWSIKKTVATRLALGTPFYRFLAHFQFFALAPVCAVWFGCWGKGAPSIQASKSLWLSSCPCTSLRRPSFSCFPFDVLLQKSNYNDAYKAL